MINPDRLLTASTWKHAYPSHRGRALVLRRSSFRAQAAAFITKTLDDPTPVYCDHALANRIRMLQLDFTRGGYYPLPIGDTTAQLFIFTDKSCALGILPNPLPEIPRFPTDKADLGTIRFVPLLFSLFHTAYQTLDMGQHRRVRLKHTPDFPSLVDDDIREAVRLIDTIGPFVPAFAHAITQAPVAPWCLTRPLDTTQITKALAGCIHTTYPHVTRAVIKGRILKEDGTLTPLTCEAYLPKTSQWDPDISDAILADMTRWLNNNTVDPMDQVAFHFEAPMAGNPGGRKASPLCRYFDKQIKAAHDIIEATSVYLR